MNKMNNFLNEQNEQNLVSTSVASLPSPLTFCYRVLTELAPCFCMHTREREKYGESGDAERHDVCVMRELGPLSVCEMGRGYWVLHIVVRSSVRGGRRDIGADPVDCAHTARPSDGRTL